MEVADEPMSISEIAAETNCVHSTINRNVPALVELGLLTKHPKFKSGRPVDSYQRTAAQVTFEF